MCPRVCVAGHGVAAVTHGAWLNETLLALTKSPSKVVKLLHLPSFLFVIIVMVINMEKIIIQLCYLALIKRKTGKERYIHERERERLSERARERETKRPGVPFYPEPHIKPRPHNYLTRYNLTLRCHCVLTNTSLQSASKGAIDLQNWNCSVTFKRYCILPGKWSRNLTEHPVI